LNNRRIIFAALAASILIFALFAAYALWFPFALDYGEGPLADQARRIAAGELLYRPMWSQSPWVINNYPPLYPALTAALGRASGARFLFAGRLISIFSTVTSAFLAAAIARCAWDSRAAGRLAAALFLGNLFVVEWAIVARVDSLALALSLAALLILQTRARSWAWLAAAAACAVGAIFTRQTFALAMPLTGAVWLWHVDRKKSIAFVFSVGGACLALFLIFNHYSNSGFYFHTMLANVNHFQWLRVLEFGGRLVAISGLTLALALATRGLAAPTEFARRALPVYAAGALLTALTVGKVGSWHNYFLELVTAIVLFGASAARDDGRRPTRWLRPLLAAQAAWAALSTVGLMQWKLSVGWHERAGYAAIAAEVARAPGPVLADDAMTMLVAAGRPVLYQPFEYRQLQTAGLWDPAPIVQDVAAGRFALIVLRWPDAAKCRERWGPEILAAVKARYRESIRAGMLVSYVPD